ncbi:MAG: SH3 domain-containing protein [Anaerolineae bacterium]
MFNKYRHLFVSLFVVAILSLIPHVAESYSGLNTQSLTTENISSVVILVHGVNSGPTKYPTLYDNFVDAIWPTDSGNTALVQFNWGIENFNYASDTVGTRHDLSTFETFKAGMSPNAWAGVDKLKTTVERIQSILPNIPISIVSHSQGTVVTLAALQEGMHIENWVLMGSPLDKESIAVDENNTHLGQAAQNVTGAILNLWSRADDTAGYKGGIGRFGLPRMGDDVSFNIPDYDSNNISEIKVTNVDHDDWWKGDWITDTNGHIWSQMTKGGTDFLSSDEPRKMLLGLLTSPSLPLNLDTNRTECFHNLQMFAISDPTSAVALEDCGQCQGATNTSRLFIGQEGRVVAGLGANNLRDNPTKAGKVVTQIPELGTFSVLDGPIDAEGLNWWKVDFNGHIGWTAEGDNSEYWVEPLIENTSTDLQNDIVGDWDNGVSLETETVIYSSLIFSADGAFGFDVFEGGIKGTFTFVSEDRINITGESCGVVGCDPITWETDVAICGNVLRITGPFSDKSTLWYRSR